MPWFVVSPDLIKKWDEDAIMMRKKDAARGCANDGYVRWLESSKSESRGR